MLIFLLIKRLIKVFSLLFMSWWDQSLYRTYVDILYRKSLVHSVLLLLLEMQKNEVFRIINSKFNR